jgi:hypothetical protein
MLSVPEAPWATEIVGVEGLMVKSGVVGVSLPTLFVPLSSNQILPEESITTS